MTVLLDLQATQHEALAERGIPRYLRELALGLDRQRPDAVDGFVVDRRSSLPPSLEPLRDAGRLRFADELDLRPGDVYHVGSPFEERDIDEVWPPGARGTGVRLVATLYDLIPDVYPEQYLADGVLALGYRARQQLVRQADRVAAISASAARDAVERLGLAATQLRVVGTGVSAHFQPPASREAALGGVQQALPAVEPSFLLYTGGIQYRKNTEGLLAAYAALDEADRRAHQLVVVCRIEDAHRAALDELAARLGIGGRVVFTGLVSDELLVLLYQACELFVFPSLYEGFGLPVAEAIACGAPVIVSDSSSLPELVADPDARFDPHDPASIAAAIRRALHDDGFRARLRAVTLGDAVSWDGVARRTAAIYEELAALGPPLRRRGRPRIAVLTPLPPNPSGAAVLAARLLPALRPFAAVDAFVPDDGAHPASRPPGVRVERASLLDVADRAVGGYHTVVQLAGEDGRLQVPFGAPDPSAFRPRQPQPGLVATFGELTAAARPDAVLEAFALIAAGRHDARLVLAGHVDDGERERLARRARELGYGSRVTIAGPGPRERYEHWLARACVAVQLRPAVDAGGLADCLAAGVPVIAAAELDAGTVVRVPPDAGPLVLADALLRLLADLDTRLALSAAGRAWCRRHSTAQAAEALARQLGIVAASQG